MNTNFWEMIQNHPNYCDICIRIGGYCGGMGCRGEFWQQDWDKVSIVNNTIVDTQNNLVIKIKD